MELLINCPVCNSTSFKAFMKSSDYFLSKEEFTIVECKDCGVKFTNPRPGLDSIIQYYDSAEYISHDTSRKGFITWIYTHARIFMLKKKFTMVSRFSNGRRILDIGCGTGEFLSYCREKGFETYGVELNDKPRELAKRRYGIEIRKKILDYSAETFKFDCITLWHVLEHIHDIKTEIASVKKLLKPDGVLIVALPNCNSWDAAHYKKYWAAYDLPRHLYHFNEFSFFKFAGLNKLRVVKIIPQFLDSFYISLLSEKYRTGKNSLIKAFINGTISDLRARGSGTGYSSLIYILFSENS